MKNLITNFSTNVRNITAFHYIFAKLQQIPYFVRMEKKYIYSTLAVSPEAHQLIKVYAAKTGQRIGAVVEEAIREYVKNNSDVGKR